MKKILTLIGLLGIATLAAHGQNEIDVGPRERPPKIDPGDEPRPVGRPTDGREVAVLKVRLDFDNGRVRHAEVVEARRIASIAPKSFQRRGGDWEVRINGSRDDAFYVFSPAYLEAETEDGAGNPYTYVAQDGVVDWSLVVPLYKDSRTIEAESIVIVDRKTGQPILEAELQLTD